MTARRLDPFDFPFCVGDRHFFVHSNPLSDDIQDGEVCTCGKMKFVYVRCTVCGSIRGKIEPVKPPDGELIPLEEAETHEP